MFSNQYISYYIEGCVCVITYAENIIIDSEVADSIIASKKVLQDEYPMVTHFIGVLNPTVKIKASTMTKFSNKEAVSNVSRIAVVYTSKTKFRRTIYRIQARLMNECVSLLTRKSNIKLRFFNNLDQSLIWINK